MAEQFNNDEQRGSIRAKLNKAIQQLNSARRDWFPNFDGDRCYYLGKKWNIASNGSRSGIPGEGSDWNEVDVTAGTGVIFTEAILSPTSGQISNASTQWQWRWHSEKTPVSHVVRLYDDNVQIYTQSGATQDVHTINGIPLDGSDLRFEVTLTYADSSTWTLQQTYTTVGGINPATWGYPSLNEVVGGGSLTASWNYGSKTPATWALTVTNTSTSSVINTYNGTTSNSQAITGLPDDGSVIALSLAITFTDTLTQTLPITFTSGASSSQSTQVAMIGGASITGEVVVAGGIAQWTSTAATAAGNAQTAFATGGGQVNITSTGTVTELNFNNAGLTFLSTGLNVRPLKFDLRSNAGLVIDAGNVDWTWATYIDLRDSGAGAVLRDQDIGAPAQMTYLDICNAPGSQLTGARIGEMTSLTRLCTQAIGLSLTDADMSGSGYNSMSQLLVGYNLNSVLSSTTLDKMPNLQLFHCPSSSCVVTAQMFVNKPQLNNIDLTEGMITSTANMDAILTQIRNNAQSNSLTNGTLRILTNNSVPTGGGAGNSDIVYLRSTLGWNVT